jgi:hypothetical protein
LELPLRRDEMQRNPRIVFYTLLTATALLVGIMHPVEATFQMQLSDGNTTRTVSDNELGADLTAGITGLITFTGTIGNFVVNVTLGSSKPMIGSATNPMLNITSFNATSSAGGTLAIILSDTDFGPVGPSAMFRTDLNGTLMAGNISAQTYFKNGTYDFFTTPDPVGSIGRLTGVASASDTRVASDIGTSFSMNMVVTLEHTGAGVSTFDATARATSVPEPSATLCLGIALFGIGGYAGWQRRKTTI